MTDLARYIEAIDNEWHAKGKYLPKGHEAGHDDRRDDDRDDDGGHDHGG
jgi:hypothetical protein